MRGASPETGVQLGLLAPGGCACAFAPIIFDIIGKLQRNSTSKFGHVHVHQLWMINNKLNKKTATGFNKDLDVNKFTDMCLGPAIMQ